MLSGLDNFRRLILRALSPLSEQVSETVTVLCANFKAPRKQLKSHPLIMQILKMTICAMMFRSRLRTGLCANFFVGVLLIFFILFSQSIWRSFGTWKFWGDFVIVNQGCHDWWSTKVWGATYQSSQSTKQWIRLCCVTHYVFQCCVLVSLFFTILFINKDVPQNYTLHLLYMKRKLFSF